MFKKIIKTFFLLAAVFSLSTTAFAHDKAIDEKMDYIIHAGGEIDEISGTNSLNALQNSFYNGYRFIEMDFSFTSDRRLVCVHDWETDFFRMNKPVGLVLSSEEFKNQKIIGIYDTLTVEELSSWLRNHGDVYIITEIKNENIEGLRYINENCGDIKNRLIVQIYNENEYDEVKKMGYDNIIYTLYALTYAEKTDTSAISDFVKSHDIAAIAFSDELVSENYINGLKESGARLFVHTINDKNRFEELKAMGISGIYSDVFKENLKEELIEAVEEAEEPAAVNEVKYQQSISKNIILKADDKEESQWLL